MADWMMLDGRNSRDMGLYVLEYPPLCVPRRRGANLSVRGGADMWLYDGPWAYEDMLLDVKCYARAGADWEAIAAYLTPDAREIIFGDQPQYALTGKCDEALELKRVLRERQARAFTLPLRCAPFKRLASPGLAVTLTAAGSIEHPGTARSYPLIEVTGTGDVDIITHATQHFAISGLESGAPILIDSGAMICTNGAGTADWSAKTAGDYPYLDPGANTVSFTGNVTQIRITPRFQWLGR